MLNEFFDLRTLSVRQVKLGRFCTFLATLDFRQPPGGQVWYFLTQTGSLRFKCPRNSFGSDSPNWDFSIPLFLPWNFNFLSHKDNLSLTSKRIHFLEDRNVFFPDYFFYQKLVLFSTRIIFPENWLCHLPRTIFILWKILPLFSFFKLQIGWVWAT